MRALILSLLCFIKFAASAQIVGVGEVSREFEVTNRNDQSPIKLSDYEGNVIILDFFAWWCGPCRSSSPIVEQGIYEYFKEQNGNDHGVPVTVIAVNIESDSPARTDQFVEEAGLKLVGDDFDREAWDQFNERSAIPLFVIINGVSGNSQYEQWEVIYKKTGFEGVNKFREIINRVEAGIRPPDSEEQAAELNEADISEFREVLDNEALNLSVGPAGAKWYVDNVISSDGSDSLKSSLIPNHSSTWIETSINGPGFVFFNWRTTNDYGQDFSCYLGDQLVSTFERRFSWNEPSWMPGLVRVPVGQHTIKWVYSKNLASKLNLFGWLDDVQFHAENEVVKNSITALDLIGLSFEFGGQGMWVADKMNGLDEGGGLTSLGVGRNGRAWFGTSVKGPAYLEFHYKTPHLIASEPALLFSLDEKVLDLGSMRVSSSQVDWGRAMVEIPEGWHQARWSAKNNVVIDLVKINWLQKGAPVIVKSPASVEISAPDSAFFEVEAMGYPFPEYQWFYKGEPLNGEIDRILKLNNLWADHSGQLSVIVSNELGVTESAYFDLIVKEDLALDLAEAIDFSGRVISMDSASRGWGKIITNSAIGQDAAHSFVPANKQGINNIFAVRVEGPGYMKFKWQLETTAKQSDDSIVCYIDDLSHPLVTLNRMESGKSSEWQDNWIFIPKGYHSVYFNFSKNSIYPVSAYLDNLEFMKVQSGKPTFVDFNSNIINVDLGESIIMPIENADGFPFPNFQWQVNQLDIPNANDSVLHIENAWDFDSASYSVILSNIHGEIRSQPVEVNVTGSGNASLAEGLDAINLKFLNTGLSDWVNILSPNSEGQDVLMSSLSDSELSSRLLTMVQGPGVLEFEWKIDGPDFDGGRLDFHINESEISMLENKSTWRKVKCLIPSGKQKLEWIFHLGEMDIGEYHGYLDNLKFYIPDDSPPVFTVQPKGISVQGIEEVLLKVEVEGWPIPELQWFHDGTPIKEANEESLSIGMIWPNDVGKYSVLAKNSLGEVISDLATVKIDREIDTDIGSALDTNIYFVPGGDGRWKFQSINTSDGIDALKLSGLSLFDPVKSPDVSYATLTTQLDGPGELLFKLKIKGSRQIFRAYLGEFSLWNSNFLTIKDQEIDWEERSLSIPEGNHTVRLMFIQGGPVKSGISSSVWIDQIKYLKEAPPLPPKISINKINEKLILNLNSESGKTYYLETSTNLKDWDISGEYGSIGESIQFDLPLNILKKSSFFRIKTEH